MSARSRSDPASRTTGTRGAGGAASIRDRTQANISAAIYVNTSKQVGDHLKVFASVDAAETWFEENDPEGAAFEYEVLE
jgi:hypothetical protein